MDLIYKINNQTNINNRLDKIESKINKMEEKIEKIILLLENNNKKCQKMSEHIDFVEHVYENVKNPLGFICKKINSIVSNDKLIENKNRNK